MKKEAKRVTPDEIKQIQLEMLDEIDSFCRQHNIRYSLAFGTLLGAIRHKGYIPWDDDVDIIMPLPDMLRFKKEFMSEKLIYCDIDTVPYYDLHFSRIAYKPTYSISGMIMTSYGVCIDLYPVVGMADNDNEISTFLETLQPLYKKRLRLISLRNSIIHRLPLKTIPGYKATIRKFYERVLFHYPFETSQYYLHAGSVRRVNIFDYDVFESMTNVMFEGHSYMAVGDCDKYLRHCFNDYMKLPPEDQRHPYHGFVYFWK